MLFRAFLEVGGIIYCWSHARKTGHVPDISAKLSAERVFSAGGHGGAATRANIQARSTFETNARTCITRKEGALQELYRQYEGF
jgi:hypothetical protein